MQKRHTTALKAVIATLALTTLTGQAFLFDDGTFDTPIPSFTDGAGWEAFGTPDAFAAIGREDWANGAPGTGGGFGYAAPDEGQFGIAFKGFSASAGGLYHDVPVEPARQYDFHIQSHAATTFFNEVTANGSVSIVFSWYDGDPTGGGALVSAISNNITSLLTDGGGDSGFPPGPTQVSKWQDWDYSMTAPAGAAYLRTTIQWTASGTLSGGDEVARWDNAQLTTSLDPLNKTEATSPVMQLTYETQDTVEYAIEATADLDMGFGLTEFASVSGNDATQQVSFLPQTDLAAFRTKAVKFADTNLTVQPFDQAGGDAGWQAFMNVFELPANGGGFVFGDNWGVSDLVSDITTTTNGGNTVVTLSPNTIGDPNVFWYQNTTGLGVPPNVGGPGQAGNKTMDANLLVSFTDYPSLTGTTVTFSGTVTANTLSNSHTAIAFIKDFAPDFGSNNSVTTPLAPGPFSLSLPTTAGAGRHIQVGFTMTGPNVWVTDVAPFGNVQVAIEASPFPLATFDTGLAQVPATVVTWDGQPGVHYLFQYSDDSGTTWFNIGTGALVGAGAPLRATDPAGTVPLRMYQVVVPPPVPLVPAP